MSLRNKLKIWFIAIIALVASLSYALLSMEFVQKKIFDVKADITGSERTVTFYAPLTAEKVASFSDKDMRFEYANGSISVWIGSKNKKVHSNMNYIIEDK